MPMPFITSAICSGELVATAFPHGNESDTANTNADEVHRRSLLLRDNHERKMRQEKNSVV